MRRWGVLGIVPLAAAVAVFTRRIDRLQTGPDAGVFVGMVRNLRSSFSLTSPTDQYWVRLSPAATVSHLGRIPVPDFGPLYAAVVAAVPAPVDLAFLLVHCAALFVAVAAIGYLAWRATASLPMAVAAQVIALWGPYSPDLFFRHGRPMDLYASIGSDGLAVALLLAGLAVLVAVAPDTPRWARAGFGAAALLTAAILTRYAVAGAVIGAAVALAIAPRDRRWRWPVIALVAGAAWQAVVYPLLVTGAGPKSLVSHRGDIAPLGVTIAGWLRIDVAGRTASAVVVIVGLGLVAVALVARRGGVDSVVALAAAGQLAILVVSRQLLDAGLNLREERHVLAVRFLLAVLAVSGLTNALRRIASPAAVTIGAIGVVLVTAVAAGGWPGPVELSPRAPALAVEPWLAAHGSVPVLSNQTDTWYTQTGMPAADVPRPAEPSTGEPRETAVEVAALAGVAPTVVQAYRPGFFEGVDLRTLACARVGDTWTGPELDGFELAVVDLTDCR